MLVYWIRGSKDAAGEWMRLPVRPVEVHKWFPGIGHVGWWGYPMGHDGKYIVFSTGWYPGSSMRQPMLNVTAVRSEDVGAVRTWFEGVVWREPRAWLKEVKSRAAETSESEVWRFNTETGGSWSREVGRRSGIRDASSRRYGMADKQSDTPPVLAPGCEELKCDVVGISKRQCRVVRRVHDATVGDAEFVQTDFPFL